MVERLGHLDWLPQNIRPVTNLQCPLRMYRQIIHSLKDQKRKTILPGVLVDMIGITIWCLKNVLTRHGKFWVMLMGVSASPIRIDFKCRRCKEKI